MQDGTTLLIKGNSDITYSDTAFIQKFKTMNPKVIIVDM
jgi:hypothetical protein